MKFGHLGICPRFQIPIIWIQSILKNVVNTFEYFYRVYVSILTDCPEYQAPVNQWPVHYLSTNCSVWQDYRLSSDLWS